MDVNRIKVRFGFHSCPERMRCVFSYIQVYTEQFGYYRTDHEFKNPQWFIRISNFFSFNVKIIKKIKYRTQLSFFFSFSFWKRCRSSQRLSKNLGNFKSVIKWTKTYFWLRLCLVLVYKRRFQDVSHTSFAAEFSARQRGGGEGPVPLTLVGAVSKGGGEGKFCLNK